MRLIPDDTKFDFVQKRWIAFIVTGLFSLVAIVSLAVQGLDLGIDFKGGSLFEVQSKPGVSAEIEPLRALVGGLGLGETKIQAVNDLTNPKPGHFQIRVQMQDGGDQAQAEASNKVRVALDPQYEIRKTETVGPLVGGEQMQTGLIATVVSLLMIGAYIWFRFEWQFAVAATVCTAHDVLMAFGFYSITREDFDLVAVAAVLTLAGYSVNDTVVIFDRIRETLRRVKNPDLKTVINDAINVNLGRTALTAVTVLLSIVALIIFAGPVLYNFSLVLAFGVILGTYSSIFVAACLLVYMPMPRRTSLDEKLAAQAGEA